MSRPEPLHFIFQHGWGLAPDLWKTWFPFLPEASEKTVVSMGYFGKPSPFPPLNSGTWNIVVCHSLGLHLLPEAIFPDIHLLVVFGGFRQFHEEAEGTSKRSRKILRLMLDEFGKSPEKVLGQFHMNCDLDPPEAYKVLATELLHRDLIFLDQHMLDVKVCEPVPKMLLLHGEKDRIVPVTRGEMLHRSLRNSELVTFPDAGHGLPFTHAASSVEMVMEKIRPVE